MADISTQNCLRYSFNVWYAIIGNKVGNLNGMFYVNLLTEVLDEMSLEVRNNIK